MFKNKKIVLLHLLYWLLVLFDVLFISNWLAQQSKSYLFSDNPLGVHPLIYHMMSHFPDVLLSAGFFYLHLLVLIPYFFRRKKYLLYTLVALASIVFLYLPIRYAIEEWYYKWIGGTGLDFTNKLYWITDCASYILRHCFIAVAYYLTWRWAINEKEKAERGKEQLSTELSFLKNQLNPHFLFNTLSNIHSLAYTQSKETPAAVMKLSEMMRYMLYDSNEPEVFLEEELSYLDGFIELQKLRSDRPVHLLVNFNRDCERRKIAPLLLIPFVENIFKHGHLYDPDNPAKIALNCTAGGLVFHAFNLKSTANRDRTSGIGIKNIRRRLELIYPGNHQLKISDTAHFFEIELIISFSHAPIFV